MTDVDLSDRARLHDGSPRLSGQLLRPEGDGPWPGVVMIHEAFGLDDVMRRQARHLAALGYLTLAVDLFSSGGAVRCLVSTIRAVTSGHGRAFGDVEAARGWLLDSPECTGKVGVIGFCLGGAFALLTASSGFDAAAVNYGQLPKDLGAALTGACPIVGSFGGRDRTLKNAAGKLDQALDRAGVAHDVKEYPDAGHAFLNDSETGPRVLRPVFRVAGIKPDPDASAWMHRPGS